MNKKLIPTIHIVNELPQWITSSDRAAYTPFSRTIWISRKRNKTWFKFLFAFIHEMGHHFIEVTTGSLKLHVLYDNLCQFKLGRK